MAAARLSAPLTEDTRQEIVRAISNVDGSQVDELDALASDALDVLETLRDDKPYKQGYVLALWLRKKLTLNEDPADPEELLQRWGVHVADLPPGLAPAMDAVACWGGGKGPAVLVNTSGRHAQSEGGRRATLAHEIAHLLVDRHRHLPLVEVLGGSTPLHLEQRARAFAAEFLLPREIAARIVACSESLAAAIETMRKTYGVSTDVAWWQVTNGPGWTLLDPDEQNKVMQWRRQWDAGLGAPTMD